MESGISISVWPDNIFVQNVLASPTKREGKSEIERKRDVKVKLGAKSKTKQKSVKGTANAAVLFLFLKTYFGLTLAFFSFNHPNSLVRAQNA